MVIGNSEGGGGWGESEANIFKGKYEALLEFPEGGEGSKTKTPSMGEEWIFSGATH